jgi:glyoxylase-like metal-dependent hydrolase (beta-lactamase superfamily II)
VQTPRIIAVRLTIFAALLALTVRGLFARRMGWRVASAGLLALFAALTSFGVWVMRRTTRSPHPLPEPERTPGGAPEQRFSQAAATATAQQMRVYPLQTGWTRVAFGQFFGGHEGWVGLRAVWNMGADEATVFWAPVHAYLIEHPTVGPLLVDTGLSRQQTQADYYTPRKGGLTGLIWKADDNWLPEGHDLLPQLARHGYQPEDIQHIVLTHLHEDHVGELARFPHATVHLSAAEWADRHRMGYAPSYAAITRWHHFTFDAGRFHSFAACHDLLGDGSIILLPTYGHSFGHTSVLLQMGDYQVCLAADALYTLRHLHADSLAAFNYFGPVGFATQQESVRRLAALQTALSALLIVPTHDPFAYTFDLVQPFLANGRLSADERATLLAYQHNLFDEHGHLKPEARPTFEQVRSDYGRVGAMIG